METNWSKPDYVPERVDVISCDSPLGCISTSAYDRAFNVALKRLKGSCTLLTTYSYQLQNSGILEVQYAATHRYRLQAIKVANGIGGI